MPVKRTHKHTIKENTESESTTKKIVVKSHIRSVRPNTIKKNIDQVISIQAMEKHKHIVTANKMLLATGGDEVFTKADEIGVMFQYEASVAGGIPIINGINESIFIFLFNNSSNSKFKSPSAIINSYVF